MFEKIRDHHTVAVEPRQLTETEARILSTDTAVPAGFPSPAQDYWSGDLDLAELLMPQRASTFIMQVAGASMERAGVFDGDRIIVDKAATPSDGDIVVAVLDGEFTVKRLRVDRNGLVRLCAENPSYPDIEIAELSELHIWGVVTWVLHRTTRQ